MLNAKCLFKMLNAFLNCWILNVEYRPENDAGQVEAFDFEYLHRVASLI